MIPRANGLVRRSAANVWLTSVWLSAAWAQTPAPEPAGALPYDAAFSIREFLWRAALAVAPDGNRVAYAASVQPADTNLSDRYQPNGVPSSVVGSQVYIAERTGGRTIAVCPAGSCWRPAWSPDGSSLAFYTDAGGSVQLWVYDRARGRARKVTEATVKPKLWAGDEPRWSPDGRLVYVPLAPEGEYRSPALPTVSARKRPGAVMVLRAGAEVDTAARDGEGPVSRAAPSLRENLAVLGAVDVRSGTVRIVASADADPRPNVLRLSASGRWVSYLSPFKVHGDTSHVSTLDLGVVPAAGGQPRAIVADLPVPQTEYFRLSYSWHPTEDRLVYLKGGALSLVEFTPDGPRPPRQLGAALGSLAPTVHWFTRDGRAVVVGTEPYDEKSYFDARPTGFAVVPLDGGEPRRFSLDDGRWIFRDIVKADERTAWQPDGASLTLVLEERATGETAVVRYDPGTGQPTVLWKGMATLGDLTGGGHHDFVVGTYEDLRTPPNVYRFTADFSSKERLSHLDPRLDSVAAGSAEIFETTVPLYNGTLTKVRTAVVLPAGAKRGDRLPAIVMMYPGADVSRRAARFGGGHVVTVPNLVFTSRGYALVLTNVPLGPTREAGNPVQEMVDVLLPQVYKAAELGYVDVERLAIGGQSYGGYGAASIISRTNLFRAAVAASAGAYDLAGAYGSMNDDGRPSRISWSEALQGRMGTHPWANLRRYVENSPYYQADKILTPLLIVHGDADKGYHEAQKLFTALRRLNRPVQLASYGGQGHVIYEWKRTAATDAARRMVAFYRKHLGDPGSAGRVAERD